MKVQLGFPLPREEPACAREAGPGTRAATARGRRWWPRPQRRWPRPCARPGWRRPRPQTPPEPSGSWRPSGGTESGSGGQEQAGGQGWGSRPLINRAVTAQTSPKGRALILTHLFQHNDPQHSHCREGQGHQDHHHSHGCVSPQRYQAQDPATAKHEAVAPRFPLPHPPLALPGSAHGSPESPVWDADGLQHIHHVLGKEDEEEDKEVEGTVTPGRKR